MAGSRRGSLHSNVMIAAYNRYGKTHLHDSAGTLIKWPLASECIAPASSNMNLTVVISNVNMSGFGEDSPDDARGEADIDYSK